MCNRVAVRAVLMMAMGHSPVIVLVNVASESTTMFPQSNSPDSEDEREAVNTEYLAGVQKSWDRLSHRLVSNTTAAIWAGVNFTAASRRRPATATLESQQISLRV
jgi:hypothetical protein